jgi:carboxylesterase type B
LSATSTFEGISANNTESFLQIRFGQSTAAATRFAHPKAFSHGPGTNVDGPVQGVACPQQKVSLLGINIFSHVADVSEDCLTLRIDRPAGTTTTHKLPVLIWIYGGGGDSKGQIYDRV